MIDSMHVLDVLRERGYVPQDDAAPGEGWFDLTTPGGMTVRAVLSQSERWAWVHLFSGQGVVWSARFSGAPGAVLLATLDAAEREAGVEPRRAPVADLLGADPEWCGGQSVDEYIRGQRER
jgi:hypothetical protein